MPLVGSPDKPSLGGAAPSVPSGVRIGTSSFQRALELEPKLAPPRLLLLRHATPCSEQEDPARPLSHEGTKEAVKAAKGVAAYLDANCPNKDLVIVNSGKLRAKQTAERLRDTLANPPLVMNLIGDAEDDEALSPNADPAIAISLLETIKTHESTLIALVGHLPHLHNLAASLLAPVVVSAKQFPAAGGLVLEMRAGRWVVAASMN